jgi:hypothetical protein
VVVAAGPGVALAGIAAISATPSSANNPALILVVRAAIAVNFHA